MISTKIKIFIFSSVAYLILFEFLFPTNGIFPPVSIIILSITELIDNFDFVTNLLSTIAAVYITILGNYVITKYLFVILTNKKYEIDLPETNYLKSIIPIFIYIPFILIALLILLWLPEFILDKYLVAIIIFIPQNLMELLEKVNRNHSNFYYFYKSLGMSNTTISNKIIFKLFEPEFFLIQLKNHSLIWGVVLTVEFIQQREGVGGIFYKVYKYQDVSLLFTITLIVVVLIFIIQKFMNMFYGKVYFWR